MLLHTLSRHGNQAESKYITIITSGWDATHVEGLVDDGSKDQMIDIVRQDRVAFELYIWP